MAARIIIIDDDEAVEAIVLKTCPKGLEVRRYADATVGLKRAYKRPPALIILSGDIDDGYAACRRIKREKRLAKIGLIIISAKATAEQFEEHAKLPAHADLYLHKPLDGELLEQAYETLITPPKTADRAAPADRATPASKPSSGVSGPKPPAAVEYDDRPPSPETIIEGLRGELAAMRKERDELRIELANLTERLHNVKSSQRRTEEGFERELVQLREAAENASNDETDRELRRVTHLYNDLLESMDVVVEALRTPLELVERHQELTAQADEARLKSAESIPEGFVGEGLTGDDDGIDDSERPDVLSEAGVDELPEESSQGFAPD